MLITLVNRCTCRSRKALPTSSNGHLAAATLYSCQPGQEDIVSARHKAQGQAGEAAAWRCVLVFRRRRSVALVLSNEPNGRKKSLFSEAVVACRRRAQGVLERQRGTASATSCSRPTPARCACVATERGRPPGLGSASIATLARTHQAPTRTPTCADGDASRSAAHSQIFAPTPVWRWPWKWRRRQGGACCGKTATRGAGAAQANRDPWQFGGAACPAASP